MSYKASAWAVKQRVGNPTRKLVLLALAENANHNGYSPVGFKYLSDVAECSPKSVQRHLEALESMDLLVRQRRRRRDGSLAGYDMWLQLHQTQFQFEDEPPADNLTTGQNDRWTPDQGTESPLVRDTESTGEGHRVHSFPSVLPQCSSPGEHARAREAVDNSRRTITWRKYELDISEGPADLTDAVVIEWLDARRAERRPCNQSTVTLWMRELSRAVAEKGWDPDRALTFAMGWQNFSADWLDRYSDEAGAASKGAKGEVVDEAWQRLLRHCRQGQNIAQVEHSSPDLAPAARELGGMAYLRGLTEREMQFQFQKFRSLYQPKPAATTAGGG